MNLANKLTFLRIILVPVMAILFLFGLNYISAAVFVIAAVTDILDGKIARKQNIVTTLGKFLDPLADKLLNITALIIIVFFYNNLYITISVIIIICRELIITALRTLGAEKGVIIAADKWGKIKTVLQDIAIVLLMINNFPFEYLGIPLHFIIFYSSVLMTIISGVNYIWVNKKLFKA